MTTPRGSRPEPGRGAVYFCPYGSCRLARRRDRRNRGDRARNGTGTGAGGVARSEEHTSKLQSPCNLVCRLLLEKKKKKKNDTSHILCNSIVTVAQTNQL